MTMSSEITNSDDSSLNTGDSEFQCPFCDAAYDHEILTRVHITRLNDDAHRNRDGLMPETPVEVSSPEYDDLDRVTRQPEEIDLRSISAEQLPEDLSPREKRIVLTAVYNPYVETYTELHDRVSGVFDERDLEPVSYNKVRETIRSFFGPFDQEVNGRENAEERYEELTEKQRKVVDAYLEDPSASQSEIAERAGVSRTYPSQIFSKYDELIAELERIHDEQETGTQDADGAPDSQNVETDSNEESDENETSDEEVSAAERRSGGSSPSDADGPVNTPIAKIMSASPYEESIEQAGDATRSQSSVNGQHASEVTGDDTSSSDTEQSETASDPASTGTGNEGTGSDNGATGTADGTEAQPTADGIPREEVLRVKERVAFLRRVAERQTNARRSSGDGGGQLAVAKEVEAELERLLSTADADTA